MCKQKCIDFASISMTKAFFPCSCCEVTCKKSNKRGGCRLHVLKQKEHFDPWIEHGDIRCAANALLILCSRVNSMVTRYLENCMAEFNQTGGFAENMTKSVFNRIGHQHLKCEKRFHRIENPY